jgi:hypothetical protein
MADGTSVPSVNAAPTGKRKKAGRCTLTPPDPQLKGAWYPGGFNPCTCQVKNRFQNEPFKCNLAPLQKGGRGEIDQKAAQAPAGNRRSGQRQRALVDTVGPIITSSTV